MENNELIKVRHCRPGPQGNFEITTMNLYLSSIIQDPTGLNMADIGIALLNRERAKLGLGPIDPKTVAGNADESF